MTISKSDTPVNGTLKLWLSTHYAEMVSFMSRWRALIRIGKVLPVIKFEFLMACLLKNNWKKQSRSCIFIEQRRRIGGGTGWR